MQVNCTSMEIKVVRVSKKLLKKIQEKKIILYMIKIRCRASYNLKA